MVLQRQCPGFLDQKFVHGNILATLLTHSTFLDAAEGRLRRRLVAGILGKAMVSDMLHTQKNATPKGLCQNSMWPQGEGAWV